MRANEDSLAMLALSRRPRFSWATTRLQIEQVGSAAAVLGLAYDGQLVGGSPEDELDAAQAVIDTLMDRGVFISTLASSDYPAALRTVHDAPPVLYWMGSMSPADVNAVSIVGTRQLSKGGEIFARDLARALAESGVPVVSGLARGIDTVAMRSSLASGGRTVGVIGTGHGVYYPKENAALQDEVATSHLLISQFSPGSSPTKQSFPMRNVVMSGFSSATVIAEASETSGTRIQARAAVKHGRPLILSENVATGRSWAKELITGGYDVSVAPTASDAYDLVMSLHRRRDAAAQGPSFGSLLSA